MNSRDVALPEKTTGKFNFGAARLEKLLIAGLSRLHRGRLTVSMPSGNSHTFTGSQDLIDGAQFHATWNLKSYRTIRRMLSSQAVGFGESYMAGEWESPDLAQLLELMACNMDAIESELDRWTLFRAWNQMRHILRNNSRRGSRRNIAYHYDLGNDFYRLWLDSSMTYSSGLFDEAHEDLASAQQNKYQQLAESLGIGPDHRVLEIGCGWGGFAEFAARTYGCHVTCLTLSEEQLTFARARIQAAGLEDLVELRFQDYRDVKGQFDRVVSIEMFEAVGEEHWDNYFKKVRECLLPGGRAGLQIISIADDRYQNYHDNADFIQKYIFPGGMLPSPARLRKVIAQNGLSLTGEQMFGLSYARTLNTWRSQFLKNWDSIKQLGYSTEFKRMWEYYFAYCEAGFRHQTIDVGHYLIEKSADQSL